MASATDMFGSHFTTILNLTFEKLIECDVQLEREMFDNCVNNAAFEVMTDQIEKMRGSMSNQPSKPAAEKKPAEKKPTDEKVKCKFVMLGGPNKGNMCGKPVKAGASGCVAHDAKMKDAFVNEDSSDEVSSTTQPTPVAEKAACEFILTKGKRVNQKCGAVVTVGDKCAVHAKSKAAPKKQSVPVPKDNSLIEEPKAIKLIVNRERDILFHPETGFVFKSKDERVVIGRVDVDMTKRQPVPVGDVHDLTEDEIAQIKSKTFDGITFEIDSKYNTPVKPSEVKPSVDKAVAKPHDDLSSKDIEDILDEVENSDSDKEDFFNDED